MSLKLSTDIQVFLCRGKFSSTETKTHLYWRSLLPAKMIMIVNPLLISVNVLVMWLTFVHWVAESALLLLFVSYWVCGMPLRVLFESWTNSTCSWLVFTFFYWNAIISLSWSLHHFVLIRITSAGKSLWTCWLLKPEKTRIGNSFSLRHSV